MSDSTTPDPRIGEVTERLKAVLIEFMQREGISDISMRFAACLVDIDGNPVNEVTLHAGDMWWQRVGENMNLDNPAPTSDRLAPELGGR